jgi:Lon protease-like protein
MAALRAELECFICLNLLCDPVTLPTCGHSFCRNCLVKSLEKARRNCPVCRAATTIDGETAPVNVVLRNVIETVFPELSIERRGEALEERRAWKDKIPLFCMPPPLFPFQPLSLHLFEPRYKCLIQRVMANSPGSQRFGYVTSHSPAIGMVGITVEVKSVEQLPTGTCNVNATAGSRFHLMETWVEDGTHGLHFGKMEPFVDEDEAAVGALAVVTREYHRLRQKDAEANISIDQLISIATDIGPYLSSRVADLPGTPDDKAAINTLLQQYSATLVTGGESHEPLPSVSEEQLRYARREHEVALAVWRNYLLCYTAAQQLVAGLDPSVLDSMREQYGDFPQATPECEAVTRLSFWLPSVLPLPADLQNHLIATTSLGERLWVLLQIVWPRYNVTAVDWDMAGEYVQCGDNMEDVHRLLSAPPDESDSAAAAFGEVNGAQTPLAGSPTSQTAHKPTPATIEDVSPVPQI